MPNQLLSFFTISSDADPGTVSASTATASTTTLSKGVYKLAALDQGLLWKLGAAVVTATTGSFLGNSDQEVIVVQANSTQLSWIRQPSATANGSINIVPVQLYDLPQGDFRKYQ